MNGIASNTKITFDVILLVGGDAAPPALSGIVVVRAGINNRVGFKVMRQIPVVGFSIKSKL